MITKIEVAPVEPTDEEMCIAQAAAKRTETPKIVSTCGHKPNWSKTDCEATPTEDRASRPSTIRYSTSKPVQGSDCKICNNPFT